MIFVPQKLNEMGFGEDEETGWIILPSELSVQDAGCLEGANYTQISSQLSIPLVRVYRNRASRF